MAKYPSLPLFTDTFIADTAHLSAQQTGALLLLLMHAWRASDCKLPDDSKVLARMARLNGRAWLANKEAIMAFWQQDEMQKWYNKRLLDERKYVVDICDKNARAGRASALKRNNRDSTGVQPNTNQNPTPIPIPIPILKKNPLITSTEVVARSDFLNVFDIGKFLSDHDLEKARAKAEGWDIYYLINSFNQWQKGKPPLKSPVGAFLAWVPKYTKGGSQ